MKFPGTWAQLPGPADLLHVIVEDLRDRDSVFVGLPEDMPGAKFAVEVADLVKRARRGRWEAVRATEARATAPSDSVTQRLDYGKPGGCILWVDATGAQDTGAQDAAKAWIDYARRETKNSEIPPICIGMTAVQAASYEECEGLRRRIWQEFVTALDSRVLVERSARHQGNGPMHTALKGALVVELAGPDLAKAAWLSRQKLDRMVDEKEHPDERVWAAQVSVLFPVVERERRRLLDAHRKVWRLPHCRENGRLVERLEELEISDLVRQADDIPALKRELRPLDWLRRVRNALAHGERVAWGTLTSSDAPQDFRE